MEKRKKSPRTNTIAGMGPFAIIGAWATGKLSGNRVLMQDLGYFLLLQIFCVGLAVISGALGYSRSVTFFSGMANPAAWALATTTFIAGSAFVFVNHVMSRLAFRNLAGRFPDGQFGAFIISLLLTLGIIALDLAINKSGIDPASMVLTMKPQESRSGEIISRYDQEIKQAQADLKAIEKAFTWKGKVWVPRRGGSTKWHSAEKVESYYAASDRLNALKDAKVQDLRNDGTVVQSDLSRFDTEIESKREILQMLVLLMYVLMSLASYRASIFSNLVLDYLDSNPLGDIPGTQEDRYGKRDNSLFSIVPPTPDGDQRGVGQIGFQQGYRNAGKVPQEEMKMDTKKMDIFISDPPKMDKAKMSLPTVSPSDLLIEKRDKNPDEKKGTEKGQPGTSQKVSRKSIPDKSKKSGRKVSSKDVQNKIASMQDEGIPISLDAVASRIGVSRKTIIRALAKNGQSIKDFK